MAVAAARDARALFVASACGGGRVRGEFALLGPVGEAGIEQFIGQEQTPEFAMQVAEDYEVLLESLEKPDLRSVARWKLEGYTNAEIASPR